jgi:mRNA-degrading endonuclease RelE of RelBE toxin-antitoxin system
MNYRIILTDNFQKEAKRFLKKYPSLKNELAELNNLLLSNPQLGSPIGKNAFKIRLAVKSKGKGKSGGMRVITYLEVDFFIKDMTNIFLLSIYDKSETATISNKELRFLIESLHGYN